MKKNPYYKSLASKKEKFRNAEKYYKHCLSLPIYPTLTEHKRSTPINLSNIKNINAKLFIDVEDWAGAVMYVRYCRKI